jgi:selenocysteine lyase/cysteine desulfurase
MKMEEGTPMSNSQSQSGTQGQGVGSPIGNDAYNVITALQAKLEGMEAYRKYQQNGTQQLWQQLTDLDTQAVQLLTQELERLVQQGRLRPGTPGQTG